MNQNHILQTYIGFCILFYKITCSWITPGAEYINVNIKMRHVQHLWMPIIAQLRTHYPCVMKSESSLLHWQLPLKDEAFQQWSFAFCSMHHEWPEEADKSPQHLRSKLSGFCSDHVQVASLPTGEEPQLFSGSETFWP